jgi:hypothetical protein
MLSNLLPHLNSNFAEVVSAGEDIEELLKDKRIVDPQIIMTLLEQLSDEAGPGNKDDEVHFIGPNCNQISQATQVSYPPPNDYPKSLTFSTPINFQTPYMTPYPRQDHTFAPSRPPHQNRYQSPRRPRNQYRTLSPYQTSSFTSLRPRDRPTSNSPHGPPYPLRQRTPLPVPINQLYERLLMESKIVRRPARIWDSQPTWFDEIKVCDFHSNERGHDIFTCPPLRGAIEGLIKQGSLGFASIEGSYAVNSPFPDHENSEVIMMSLDQAGEPVQGYGSSSY